MIHFSCDACGCLLDHERYTVTVEVKAEHDPAELTAADLDADHLAQIAAELDAQMINGECVTHAEEPRRKKMSFDLCPRCRDRFVADPIGRESRHRLDFSKN